VTHPAFHSPLDEPRREPGDAVLIALADRLRARGDAESVACAAELEARTRELADERDGLLRRMFESLSVNHDVNNALVGIFGNAQLLGLGPAAKLPGVADRLAVIIREAERIKQAAIRIAELKHGLVVGGTKTKGEDA
jgi:signal transduction histidine kinase